MANSLVIVESPAKVKTIKKFLGSTYEVDASNGHVRDLPKSQLGIDVENDYEPKYITIRGKGDILAKLRKEVKKADKLDKLAQYATRVWHITEGTTEEKADKAIAKTREFFESLGVSTHLKDYGLGAEAVDKIVKQLEDHGMTRLGEKGDVTPEVAREILTRAL